MPPVMQKGLREEYGGIEMAHLHQRICARFASKVCRFYIHSYRYLESKSVEFEDMHSYLRNRGALTCIMEISITWTKHKINFQKLRNLTCGNGRINK